MRFREFKLIKESPEQGKFYTIGDSHAVAVALTGGKNWVNLAINGRSSTDPAMLANIQKIPKGSTVLVSQGANDTAIALSQGGKTPPQTIASNVAKVVDQVKAQGANVVFLLFPVGQGRGNPQYQEAVRKSINSAIGNVPIIDLNGKPLQPDQVHAQMGVYRDVANQVVTQYGKSVSPDVVSPNKLGPQNATPQTPTSKERAEVSPLKQGPPYPPEFKSRVQDLQKSLVNLGYSVGPPGIDGKYGPHTAAAVTAFKKDYGIEGEGSTFDNVAQSTLDKVQSGAIARVEAPTKIAATVPKGLVSDRAKVALNYFVKKGWTAEQAAGIVGNLQAESGANLKTNALGDGGKAYGIAQWHPPRQADFKKAFGKDIRDSTFEEQLAFVHWELTNTESKAGRALQATNDPKQAAIIVDTEYERSAGIHRTERIQNALALSGQDTTSSMA